MVEQTDDRATSNAGPTPPLPGSASSTMLCPVCGYANLQGEDECANCGADLRSSDIPVAVTQFERLLVDVKLRSIETRRPFTASADDSVAAVLEAMCTKETADVLIVDGGRLAGIFTERDALIKLAGLAAGTPSALGATPIRDVMTVDPVVLRPDDSVAVAVQKMAVGGFRHIPLVDDGRPIGVISAADIFRHILRVVE